MVSGTGDVAARWFGVRADFEHVSRLKMAWLAVRGTLIDMFVFWGVTAGDIDPSRFCDVVVYRRDTRRPVVTYHYKRLGEADGHVVSLLERLEGMHVYDFCRELGIAIDEVVGAGTSDPLDRDARLARGSLTRLGGDNAASRAWIRSCSRTAK